MPETATILKDLSAVEKRTIAALKKTVSSIADKFAVVRETAKDVAPRVMKAFKQLAAKHDDLDFIGFTRLFDPTIPTHADPRDGVPGYREHKMYYTLDYLRRVARPRRTGTQGKKDPARDQLARLVVTLKQFLPEGPIYTALKREFNFSDRMIARIKTRTEDAKPLLNLAGLVRPVAVTEDRIVHMNPQVKAKAGAAADVGAEDRVMEAATKAIAKRRGRPRKQAAEAA